MRAVRGGLALDYVRDDMSQLLCQLDRGKHGEEHEKRNGSHPGPSVTQWFRAVNGLRGWHGLQ
jgi:hypothetical protein